VRPDDIAVQSPDFDHDLGLLQEEEDLSIEQLISSLSSITHIVDRVADRPGSRYQYIDRAWLGDDLYGIILLRYLCSPPPSSNPLL
jgi:hypothetical protein